jgi:hypothetical protein
LWRRFSRQIGFPLARVSCSSLWTETGRESISSFGRGFARLEKAGDEIDDSLGVVLTRSSISTLSRFSVRPASWSLKTSA